MRFDQEKIKRAIAACEDAYLRCFCTAEEVQPPPAAAPLIRYRDDKLPDMHFHNGTSIPRDAYGSEEELAALCQGELNQRRAEGASFCKLGLSEDPTPLLDQLDAPGEVQHFGHYLLSDPRSAGSWTHREDGEIRRTTAPDEIDGIIAVDEAYTEGAMTEFLQRKNRRRGEVYVAEGCVENYTYRLHGQVEGICDLFVADGMAKIEDFVVSPAAQRQGIGSTLLAHVVKEAQNLGAERIYLLTDEGDTAKDMYLKMGFDKVDDSYALLFQKL